MLGWDLAGAGVACEGDAWGAFFCSIRVPFASPLPAWVACYGIPSGSREVPDACRAGAGWRCWVPLDLPGCALSLSTP